MQSLNNDNIVCSNILLESTLLWEMDLKNSRSHHNFLARLQLIRVFNVVFQDYIKQITCPRNVRYSCTQANAIIIIIIYLKLFFRTLRKPVLLIHINANSIDNISLQRHGWNLVLYLHVFVSCWVLYSICLFKSM